ncbi:hypothetical protein A2U01_0116659, partial [Trifolium medium]|nr:hypothetical protein [Trifolium medium]
MINRNGSLQPFSSLSFVPKNGEKEEEQNGEEEEEQNGEEEVDTADSST